MVGFLRRYRWAVVSAVVFAFLVVGCLHLARWSVRPMRQVLREKYERIKREKYDFIKIGMSPSEVRCVMGSEPGPVVFIDPRIGSWGQWDFEPPAAVEVRRQDWERFNIYFEDWTYDKEVWLRVMYRGGVVVQKVLARFEPDKPDPPPWPTRLRDWVLDLL